MNKIRDEKCENCNRFSHCNNNELVCISKYRVKYQKLEQVKQENKRLLEIINAKPLETVDMDCAFEIEKLKKQLQAKEQECEELKNEKAEIKKYLGISSKTVMQRLEELQEYKDEMKVREDNYKQALGKIKEIAQTGLKPICYKSNCSRCECYDGDNCNAGVINFLNYYFDDNGDLRNDEDLDESLRDLVDTERQKCNRAMPISKKILDIINKAKDGE